MDVVSTIAYPLLKQLSYKGIECLFPPPISQSVSTFFILSSLSIFLSQTLTTQLFELNAMLLIKTPEELLCVLHTLTGTVLE